MVRKIHIQEKISNPTALKIIIKQFSDEPSLPLQRRTLDYLRTALHCSPEVSEKIFSKLIETGLNEDSAVILLNSLPSEITEARALVSPVQKDVEVNILETALKILGECIRSQE